MQDPPALFDRTALARHRARARRAGPALFLHRAVAAEIEQRRGEVNKIFHSPAVVTGFPEVWDRSAARIVPDDAILDLRPGGHDLLIHALALHWANDPVGQLVQCRRALRPDGLLIAALFGGRTLNELRDALARAEARVVGGISPRVAPMAEIRDLGSLLQRAGFALPVADSVPTTVTYAGMGALLADLRAMGEANAMSGRLRRPTRRGLFAEAARHYRAAHGADGRLPATFEIIYLTGWAPGPGQQKPLRPGSARARLADALGVAEHAAGDPPRRRRG